MHGLSETYEQLREHELLYALNKLLEKIVVCEKKIYLIMRIKLLI